MKYKTIEYNVQDRILTISLNRPDRMNAFTTQMSLDLADAFQNASNDDEVSAVVFTGNGKAFCAGADLGAGEATFNYDQSKEGDDLERMRDSGGIVTLAMFECTKPIIAAINGAAVGIGATMPLAADIRLCTDNVKFGFVFPRRGLVPEAASSWFLPRIVGISQALEWCMSGRLFKADEAKQGGLVKESYETTDMLLDAAYSLAHEITDNSSPVSVALTRQMLWRMLGADHPMEAHKIDSRGIYYRGKTADVKEGVMSFLEKRAPNFPGKPSSDMPEFYPWWDEREFE